VQIVSLPPVLLDGTYGLSSLGEGSSVGERCSPFILSETSIRNTIPVLANGAGGGAGVIVGDLVTPGGEATVQVGVIGSWLPIGVALSFATIGPGGLRPWWPEPDGGKIQPDNARIKMILADLKTMRGYPHIKSTFELNINDFSEEFQTGQVLKTG